MATEQARARSDKRKTLIEPVFGILKDQQCLNRFLLRGLENVSAEWSLLAVAFNLRTLARAWQQWWHPPPKQPDLTAKSAFASEPSTTRADLPLASSVRQHICFPTPFSIPQPTTI